MCPKAAASGEGADAAEWFRVRVSLERFFSDERARCVMAAARGRSVRWLARRVRRTFGLPRRVALLARGHLLPPAEPLALLAADDTVEVIPATVAVADPSRVRRPAEEEVTAEGEGARRRVPSAGEVRPAPAPPAASADETDAAPAHARGAEESELARGKRRALALLEGLGGAEARAPRRRRTRVRRRAPAPAPAQLGAESADADSTVEEVVRNGQRPGGRAPRRVRALEPAPPPAPPAPPAPRPRADADVLG